MQSNVPGLISPIRLHKHRTLKESSAVASKFHAQEPVSDVQQLRSRIKGLEEENATLQECVNHYRLFLSGKPIHAVAAETSNSATAQLNRRETAVQTSSSETPSLLSELQDALNSARQKISTLERSNHKLQDVKSSSSNQSESETSQLQAENARLQLKLRNQSNSSAIQQATHCRKLHNIRTLFSQYKASWNKEKSVVTQSLASIELEMKLNCEVLRCAVRKLAARSAELELEHAECPKKEAERGNENELAASCPSLQDRNGLIRAMVDTLILQHQDQLAASARAAHIKDLGRLAALREHQLLNERLSAELSFAKEVQQVLSFGCNTVENVLSDSQPGVVEKVSSGRKNRLLSIERAQTAARRELDQRSQQTVELGVRQLEKLENKAANKLALCRERSSSAALDLYGILSCDTAGVVIPAEKVKAVSCTHDATSDCAKSCE